MAAAQAVLERESGVDTDYVALVDPDTFEALDDRAHAARQGVLAVAARVGSTRLIDNEYVDIDETAIG